MLADHFTEFDSISHDQTPIWPESSATAIVSRSGPGRAPSADAAAEGRGSLPLRSCLLCTASSIRRDFPTPGRPKVSSCRDDSFRFDLSSYAPALAAVAIFLYPFT